MTVINSSVCHAFQSSLSSAGSSDSPAHERDMEQTSHVRNTGIAARPSEMATRSTLLAKIQNQRYGALISSQEVHARNVAHVYESVEDFIDQFVFEHPQASSVEIRTAVSENMGAILKAAQIDPSCYQVRGSGIEDYGKHLLFSSLGMNALREAPLCFQLFRFDPNQKTPALPEQKTRIHNHPNPEQDPEQKQTLLVECASCVLSGSVSERKYLPNYAAGTAQKTGKDHRDDNRRAVDNPGANPPHSIKSIGDVPAFTVHAYTMDGISREQTAAVQTFFTKVPNREIYLAYNSLVDKVAAGIPKISAADAINKLRSENQMRRPLVVDIREPKERRKEGMLNLDDAEILLAPRGVAFAEIIDTIPDPENAELILCCVDGGRSALLARDLHSLGYRAVFVCDGVRGFGKMGLLKKGDEDGSLPSKREARDLAPGDKLAKHLARVKASLPNGISAINADELAHAMKNEKFTVFDLRQEEERKNGCITNAQRVEAGKLEMKVKFHAPDFEKPVVVYSDGDGDYRALTAAMNLAEMGYTDVRFLQGGYSNYKRLYS